jgi:signal transduction histidine kinase
LARELHDSVTQSLYSLTLLAEGYRLAAEKGNLENIGESFTDLVQLSNQVLKEMRLLLYELRPSTIDQDGFVGALHRRLDAVEGRAGIKTRLLVDEDFNLTGQTAEEIYGITQEALNNALKHSHASSVILHCSRQNDHIELEIKDDGYGFDISESKNGGMGLTNMKERAERIGASLNVISKPGNGTIVRISMPPIKIGALAG